LFGEDIFLAGAAPVPTASMTPAPAADPLTLAKSGRTEETLAALRDQPAGGSAADAAATAVGILLEGVKENLKDGKTPSSRTVSAEATCALILAALPDLLPADHSRVAELTAKAHNRRGDALLLLGRPREALAEFDAAQPLAPDDPYILYNRARAYLALGDKDSARRDFTAATDEKFDKPLARKLAKEALAKLE
jgi:tetratricopeptide (TPR) repeat protein